MFTENTIINGMKLLRRETVTNNCQPFIDPYDGRTRTTKIRTMWVCQCIKCGKERRLRLDSINIKVTLCQCSRLPKERKYKTCVVCGKPKRGRNRDGAAHSECHIKANLWSIEKWIKAGRPYFIISSSGASRGKYNLNRKQKAQLVRDFLYQEQNGLCALCHQPLENSNKTAYLDHCHKNGQVRGLVHPACNILIAAAENLGFPIPYEELCLGLKNYLNKDIPQTTL
jgi:hypothetical protein